MAQYNRLHIVSATESFEEGDAQVFDIVSKLEIDGAVFVDEFCLDWMELFVTLRFSGETTPLTCTNCGRFWPAYAESSGVVA